MISLKKNLKTALAGSCLLAASVAGAESATVPASFHGTYDVTFANAQPGSPLANGDSATMVLAPGNVICIADFVLSAPELSASGTEAIWSAPAVGVKLALSNISNGTFNEVNVATSAEVFLGQLKGEKVSSSTTGCGADNIDQIAELFTLAESVYPDLLPAASASAAFQVAGGYLFRGYPATGITLAVKDGTVYVTGGGFGSEPQSVGQIAALVAELQGIDPGDVDEPDIDIPEGDYDLTVSGSIEVAGFSQAFSVLIENLPAPDESDIEDTEKLIRDTLEDQDFGEITSVTVSNVSVSSSEVTFDIDMQAVSSGQNIRYLLKYHYVKQ